MFHLQKVDVNLPLRLEYLESSHASSRVDATARWARMEDVPGATFVPNNPNNLERIVPIVRKML
jgi:hypothetical protein